VQIFSGLRDPTGSADGHPGAPLVPADLWVMVIYHPKLISNRPNFRSFYPNKAIVNSGNRERNRSFTKGLRDTAFDKLLQINSSIKHGTVIEPFRRPVRWRLSRTPTRIGAFIKRDLAADRAAILTASGSAPSSQKPEEHTRPNARLVAYSDR